MALLEKQLEIKESNIEGAGKGLFTNKFIPKGTRIAEYKGKIRTWKEVEYEDENYYIFYVNENHVIDAGKRRKSIARYINDARGLHKIKGLLNNAVFNIDNLKVFVVSTKDIPAGAEIFVGYGKEYWDVIRKNKKADNKTKRKGKLL